MSGPAETIWSVIAVIGGILVVAVILYCLLTGHDDRDKEEAAREYFDEHGYWPDEAPAP
jgi:hypothetical protein